MVSMLGSATANGRMVIETLAQVLVGTFRWTKPRDVRAAISILHELTHLQQDVSTGLGAWDHLQTRESIPALVVESRAFIGKYSRPPYRQAIEDGVGTSDGAQRAHIEGLLRQIREESIGFRYLAGGQWCTPAAKSALARWVGDDFAAAAEQGEYSLRQVLEGEAACTVSRIITNASAAPETHAELDKYESLWRVHRMPDVYGDALIEVMTAIANETITGTSFNKVYEPAMLITPWLLDLAQGHPGARFAQAFGADAVMFDPVVRFLVLIKALNKMPGDDYVTMVGLIVEGELQGAERILLQSSNFSYPSSQDIYTDWIAVLDELMADHPWDEPLLRMRYDAISHRLESGSGKGITELVGGRTPLQMMVEGYGIQGVVVGDQLLDEVKGPLFEAMIERNVDLELFDLLLAGGTFTCPFARAHVCDARTARCSDGAVSFGQLPQSDVCRVKSRLESWGYGI